MAPIARNAVSQPDRPDFVPAPAPRTDRPDRNGAAEVRDARPHIIITQRELRDLTADGLAAIRAANTPPTLFRRGGLFTRFRLSETGTPVLEPLTESALRGVLARVADWQRATQDGPVPVHPPLAVVRDILALPDWPGIPPLDGLIEAPTFAPDGTLLTTAGYLAATRLWFHAAPGFGIPDVPAQPSSEAVCGDNLKRRLDSAALAAVLTATVWTDRILGRSAVITLPVRAVWLATGNNVACPTKWPGGRSGSAWMPAWTPPGREAGSGTRTSDCGRRPSAVAWCTLA